MGAWQGPRCYHQAWEGLQNPTPACPAVPWREPPAAGGEPVAQEPQVSVPAASAEMGPERSGSLYRLFGSAARRHPSQAASHRDPRNEGPGPSRGCCSNDHSQLVPMVWLLAPNTAFAPSWDSPPLHQVLMCSPKTKGRIPAPRDAQAEGARLPGCPLTASCTTWQWTGPQSCCRHVHVLHGPQHPSLLSSTSPVRGRFSGVC